MQRCADTSATRRRPVLRRASRGAGAVGACVFAAWRGTIPAAAHASIRGAGSLDRSNETTARRLRARPGAVRPNVPMRIIRQ